MFSVIMWTKDIFFFLSVVWWTKEEKVLENVCLELMEDKEIVGNPKRKNIVKELQNL